VQISFLLQALYVSLDLLVSCFNLHHLVGKYKVSAALPAACVISKHAVIVG